MEEEYEINSVDYAKYLGLSHKELCDLIERAKCKGMEFDQLNDGSYLLCYEDIRIISEERWFVIKEQCDAIKRQIASFRQLLEEQNQLFQEQNQLVEYYKMRDESRQRVTDMYHQMLAKREAELPRSWLHKVKDWFSKVRF